MPDKQFIHEENIDHPIVHEKQSTNISTTVIAGAGAGLISKSVVHPLDTCRVLLMVQKSGSSTRYQSLINLLKNLKSNGSIIQVLYRAYGFC